MIEYLNSQKGKKYGLVKVRLYRPFDVKRFNEALPKSAKRIAVLDRTKEPGSIGEPLYLDVVAALAGKDIRIIGGRYGLSSKEFTPSMIYAIYKHSENNGFHGFTVGIEDDVTNYMANNFKFFFAEIDGDFTTRKGIQNRLINSLKELYSNMDLSEWLGSFSTHDRIRTGGMWEMGDQDAGYADEEDLEILFNGADYDEVETFRIYMAYVEKLKRDG